MTKPKTFRKASSRELRTAKVAAASEAIGRIEPDTDTFILTYGQFSLIDALVAILDQTGPATVDLSTWTAADAHLERSRGLLESAHITRLRMIVDRSFETRQPEYCAHLRNIFSADCIRAIRTHAKFMVIRSATHDVVVRTSMNLNENPRLENLEVSWDRAFAEYFTAVVDEVFSEIQEGQNQSPLPGLPGIPESYPFREVEARPFQRELFNEPGYTHTLKKL